MVLEREMNYELMSKSAVRDKVSHAMSNDELDHIFDTDGFIAQ